MLSDDSIRQLIAELIVEAAYRVQIFDPAAHMRTMKIMKLNRYEIIVCLAVGFVGVAATAASAVYIHTENIRLRTERDEAVGRAAKLSDSLRETQAALRSFRRGEAGGPRRNRPLQKSTVPGLPEIAQPTASAGS